MSLIMVFTWKAVISIVAICPILNAVVNLLLKEASKHFLHIVIPQSSFRSRYWHILGGSGHFVLCASPHLFVQAIPSA